MAVQENGAHGFSFTEIMSGFIHVGGEMESYEVAERVARGRSESARVFLSVKTENVQQSKSRVLMRNG